MAAPASPPALPPSGLPRRHRKRVSVSRLSSDTTASLPPYRSSLVVVEPFEQPPDYPDSAEEADEETDDQVSQLLSPPISPRPRRRKLFRSVSQPRPCNFYDNPSTQSDIFLDKILERSVVALELSNTLLQSSMSTQSSLNSILSPELPSPDHSLDSQARQLSDRIRGNYGMHERWMDDLDVLARDVEALCDDEPGPRAGRLNVPGRLRATDERIEGAVSMSLPSSGLARKPRRSSFDLCKRGHSDSGRLCLTSDQRQFSACAPRAMTQYVNVGAELGDTLESSSDVSSILLPSTTGLRSCSTVSNFSSPMVSTFSPPPPSPSAYASLARQASRSPPSSRSPSASGSSSRTFRQSSRSRTSNQPPSPHLLPRIIPPLIQELPSQSDSSSSDSPHPLRTLETLRKILDEQPMPSSTTDSKGKQSESKSPSRPAPSFLPRSPPVEPVLSTSTTTTSISRLYTKGSHSTSTRPRSPPRHSSLKHRPSPIETDPSVSTTSISDLRSPVTALSSTASSGRSTPRSVAFGPLPEPLRPDGAPSRFKEQRDGKAKAKAKARSKSRSRDGERRDGKGKGSSEKEKDGESSWWTTWLTGGSVLSMSASRLEERAEDRMARSWGRPGMGVGFEEWPV